MKLLPQIIQYQEIFSLWAGCKIDLQDDFELFCESEFDFIEILMLFEQEFSVNLLDSAKVRKDFDKVHEFLSWVTVQPEMEQPFSFLFSFKFKALSIPKFVDRGGICIFRPKIKKQGVSHRSVGK